MVEDAVSVIFMYPFAIDQVDEHLSFERRIEKDAPGDIGLDNVAGARGDVSKENEKSANTAF